MKKSNSNVLDYVELKREFMLIQRRLRMNKTSQTLIAAIELNRKRQVLADLGYSELDAELIIKGCKEV